MRVACRHTGQVRHTVRERLRGISGAQAAIVLFAAAIVFIVSGMAFSAWRDDGGSPAVVPTTTTAAASVEPKPLVNEQDPEDGSRSSVAAMVAGFGLVGLWVVAGGVALFRAHRGRSGTAERDPA